MELAKPERFDVPWSWKVLTPLRGWVLSCMSSMNYYSLMNSYIEFQLNINGLLNELNLH